MTKMKCEPRLNEGQRTITKERKIKKKWGREGRDHYSNPNKGSCEQEFILEDK